ncbi:MAG TPA: hypothetical protein VFK05_23895 [Polyangiaceae bacterium]|nr:hypothetical protein [Polyangiaceae bacterium]
MIRLSQCLMAGATFGLCLNCGSSTPSSNAAAGHGPSTGGANPGSGGSPEAGSNWGNGGDPDGSGGSNSSGPSGAGKGGASGHSGGAGNAASGTSTAADVARKLGRPANFLIGMGNDLNNDHSKDGAYTLGQTLDLHYAYLVASVENGVWKSWKDWDPDGAFVDYLTDSADKAGVVPMFTVYGMRALGDGNLKGLTDDSYQKSYWADMKLLYQHLAKFDKPSVVHLEPDFWAYAEQQSHEDPSSMKVNLTANVPECADLSDDLIGMGHCHVKFARMYAPKAILGFHASQWASGDPNAIATFFKKVGADTADVVIADLLDRDAGCFEAAVDPNCMRGGSFYWDETNTKSPNFHEYLAWAKAITSGVGRPMLWWQIPFGVPSDTPGGTAGHYRDNRVHYIFSHIQEFVDAGGLGACFGTGAGNQTYIDTDGGQFKNAVTAYYMNPTALP